VRLDLRGERVRLQPERFDERRTDRRPVVVRQGDDVGVVIAHGAVPFAEDRYLLPARQSALEACQYVREFFAERRRTRGLAMRPCEHRQIGMLICELPQRSADRGKLGEQGNSGALQHAGIGQIVDVLGSAAEMHEFEHGVARSSTRELLAHVVLDRLDVVIGALLDRLHGGGGRGGRRGRQLSRNVEHGCRNVRSGGEARRSSFGECQQPLGLDPDALADQRRFGKVLSQRQRAARVAAVDGRESVETVESHGGPVTLEVLGCESYPMPDAALVFGHPPDLRESLRTCLLREPCHAPINDWRHGEVTPERRARLRRFFPDEPIPAAVLVPFVERREGATILLTQRAAHLKTHAGQISFPGGRVDDDDADAIATALRETEEEIGLSRRHVEVIGCLPDYQTGTGFRVTPVAALVHPPFELQADSFEVAEIFEVPMAFLMDGTNHQRRSAIFPNRSSRRSFYTMPFEQYFIWGATAAMLRNLYHFLRAD